MKSYILEPIESRNAAITALSTVLPGQTETWLLKDASGDTIAYFYLAESNNTTDAQMIVADMSGRHYNRDADVISILQTLKIQLGGEITYVP